METHKSHQFPQSKVNGSLDESVDKHSNGHVSKEHNRSFTSFQCTYNNTFKFKSNGNDFLYPHWFEILLLQKHIPVLFHLIDQNRKGGLDVQISTIQACIPESVLETLRNTKVILVFAKKTENDIDHAMWPYQIVIPFDTQFSENGIFGKLNVMSLDSKTRKSYFDSDGLNIKIEFQFPNLFEQISQRNPLEIT